MKKNEQLNIIEQARAALEQQESALKTVCRDLEGRDTRNQAFNALSHVRWALDALRWLATDHRRRFPLPKERKRYE